MTRIGDNIKVKGVTYRVAEAGPSGTGKFFGKRIWTLVRAEDGARFQAFGKSVAANSTLVACGEAD